ncbi:MAG: biotin/lipoate A/B protein ligase family protein [Anaerolineae bacterium]|nr:biotin/lipoate A/B protein ligase family protein [Anaerolineae bacterium]
MLDAIGDTSRPTLPRATWRLVDTGWQGGPANMAIDEAIMEAVEAGDQPPTLRIYGWQPACLSLGRNQPWLAVDWEACLARGWDVVRRPTGGRAILHVDELTYSVSAPEDEPRVHGGILPSYMRLSNALAAGLSQLGLTPQQAGAPEPDAAKGPVCFDSPSNYEITAGGRKLIGSAQARRRGMVLQHGTLPLYGDLRRIVQALHYEEERERAAAASALIASALTLEEALGRRVAYDEATTALAAGFASALNLQLEKGSLSAAEIERAQTIRAEKYGHDEWTRRNGSR